MQTIDLRKELKPFYAAPVGAIEVVDVPPLLYLAVDGVLEPGSAPATSPSFQDAVAALYGAAYTLKFTAKLRADDPVDWPVMPLEGLWAQPDGSFEMDAAEPWLWMLMIVQPRCVTEAMLTDALLKVRQKRDPASLDALRLGEWCEGLSIQTMHVGPYAEEPATLQRMRRFADENRLVYAGKHHEIYLGDPRRTRPERLRTLLRQPVSRQCVASPELAAA